MSIVTFQSGDKEKNMAVNPCEYVLPHPSDSVLHFNGKSISSLPENVFQTSDLNNVKEFIMQGTEVENLPESFTVCLPNLENLKLLHNKLHSLPRNTNDLQFLKYLSVSHNKLNELPDINSLVNLKHLDISNNLISTFSLSVVSLSNLRHLNVSNNSVVKLPDEIGNLTSLEYFDASKNVILNIPHKFGNLKHLSFLNLSSNSLSDLPESLDIFGLRTLILSHNRFQNLPDCIMYGLPNISVLDLSHNDITFFDNPPKCVSKLTNFSISHNSFHDIPQWLFGEKCRVLKELNISDNKHMIGTSEQSSYSKSGERMGVSTSLKILKASNCCFSSSSVQFLCGLKALESLTLGNEVDLCKGVKHIGNILFNFPSKTLNTCSSLKYLNMNNVGLSDLPDDIGSVLTKLELLDLSFNELINIPDSFCKLVTLSNLRISCNELRSLPPEFGLLVTLEELRLDGNKLQSLPESFKKLKKLRVLDLYDNIFADFPDVLLSISSLETLDVELNYFSIYDASYVQGHSTFINQYNQMKNNLRALINNSNQILFRQDGKRSDISGENESCEGDLPNSDMDDLEDVSSDEFDEEGFNAEPEETSKKVEEVENWDLSDDSDSHFNPNSVKKIPKQASYGPSLLVYDAVNTTDSFCPADHHSEPIRRCRKTWKIEKVVEGQFDDADS